MENRRDEDIGEARLEATDDATADRRKFLSALGRFSVVTPPAITLLLSTSLTSQAIARSGGMGNNGFGNGGGDGSPNGMEDINR